MSFTEEICPQCGCRVHVDRERGFSFCSNCGTRVYMSPDIGAQTAAEEALVSDESVRGTSGAKYTSISRQEFERLRQENTAMSFDEYGGAIESNEKRGGIVTFIVLLLVCLLAAGGMILLLNRGDWSKERDELAAKIQYELEEEKATASPSPTPTPKPTPTPEPEPALDLSAAQAMTIEQLYQKTESGEAPLGSSAAVSGIVESVVINGRKPIVILCADDKTVSCEFDADYAEEAVTLANGDKAVVAGLISESIDGGAAMSYCRLTSAFDAVFAELEPVYGEVINVKKDVNVREEPNTECEVLGSAKKGELYRITSEQDEWFEIDFDGRTGYISRDFFAVVDEKAARYKSETTEPDYKKLLNAPDEYIGQKFNITVKIDDYDKGGELYHAHKSSRKWLVEYTAPDGEQLEDGKTVVFYGEFTGLEKPGEDSDDDDMLPKLDAAYCDID